MHPYPPILESETAGGYTSVQTHTSSLLNSSAKPISDGNRDVDDCDFFGCTALMTAAKNGDFTAVNWLILEHKADINCIDSDGYSALMYAMESACMGGNHNMDTWRSIIAFLLKQDGISLQHKGKNGETASSLFESSRLRDDSSLRDDIKNYLLSAARLNGDTESADKIKKTA